MMGRNESFWLEQNAWWGSAAQRLAAGGMTVEDWSELNRRVWCLTRRLPPDWALTLQDREAVVQAAIERLQKTTRRHRLSQIEAPAHYVAKLMKNLLLKERRNAASERRAAKQYARDVEIRRRGQQPDQEASKNDFEAKVRYVVNHV